MLRRILLAAALAATCAGGWAAEQPFKLPGDASVALNLPDSWQHEQQAEDPRAIVLRPGSGRAFRVELTPVRDAEGRYVRTDTPSLRALVGDMAQKALAQVEDKELPLQFLFGNGRGIYYTGTLRGPRMDGYRKLYQGIMSMQGIPVAFTVLSDGKDQAAVEAALNVIRSARRF